MGDMAPPSAVIIPENMVRVAGPAPREFLRVALVG